VSARLRGLLLLGVALGVVASWRLGAWPGAEAGDEVVAPAARRGSAAPGARAAVPVPEPEVCGSTELPRRSAWADEGRAADPFAARAPAPLAKPVVAVVKPFVGPLPEVVAPPPPPPQLPYRFLGQWAERDGSQAKVFLLLGERLLMAAPGDLLEGGWRLDRIQASELKFVRPSDQYVLTLAIDRN
jgi:hypothetical protein